MEKEESIKDLESSLSDMIIDLNKYQKVKTIGKGGYGIVHIAIEQNTQKKYALKELYYNQLEGRQLKLFCREVEILSKCDNPFLLNLSGFTIKYPYAIITEYVPNGSLFDSLHHSSSSPTLNGTNKTIIAMGIAYGMWKLHQLNILHRDLKSLNVLLDENLYPKICDFGISRFKNDESQLSTIQIGTPHWMAPEMYETKDYTYKVDVYSFGILLWELLTEQTPYKGKNPTQIMIAVCRYGERPQIPSNAPKELSELIKLCWFSNPEIRPSFENIFNMFSNKRVRFESCDELIVDKFLCFIKSYESRNSKIKLPRPLIYYSHLKSEEDIIKNIESSNQGNLNGLLQILNNKMSVHIAPVFISSLVLAMEKNNSLDAWLIGLKYIQKMTDMYDFFYQIVLDCHISDILPISNEVFFPALIPFIIRFISKDSTFITLDQIRIIAGRCQYYPFLISDMFFQIFTIVDEHNPSLIKIVSMFFQVINQIKEKGSIESVIRVLSALKKQKYITKTQSDNITSFLSEMLSSNMIESIKGCYGGLNSSDITELSLEEYLIIHINDNNIRAIVIEFLLRSEPFKLPKQVIDSLVYTNKVDSSIRALLKHSVLYDNAIYIYDSLIQENPLPPLLTLHVLESLIIHDDLRKIIHQFPLIFNVFHACLENPSVSISTICWILVNMNVKEISIPVLNEIIQKIVNISIEKYVLFTIEFLVSETELRLSENVKTRISNQTDISIIKQSIIAQFK